MSTLANKNFIEYVKQLPKMEEDTKNVKNILESMRCIDRDIIDHENALDSLKRQKQMCDSALSHFEQHGNLHRVSWPKYKDDVKTKIVSWEEAIEIHFKDAEEMSHPKTRYGLEYLVIWLVFSALWGLLNNLFTGSAHSLYAFSLGLITLIASIYLQIAFTRAFHSKL